MKKRTLWIISTVMLIAFSALLYLQFHYYNIMSSMRQDQVHTFINSSIDRALENVRIKNLEYLFEHSDSNRIDSNTYYILQVLTTNNYWIDNDKKSNNLTYVNKVKQNLKQLGVIYSLIPIEDRLQMFKDELEKILQSNIPQNKLLNFHYCVTDSKEDTTYTCSDYNTKESSITYIRLIPNPCSENNIYTLSVTFPSIDEYIISSTKFIIPSICFTLVLFLLFVFTIYSIFKQKQFNEMKTDFINNMTHEFKTPISSISLAAEMLKDPELTDNNNARSNITKVIIEESKRLRYQIDKVLQISLLEKSTYTLKKSRCDVNELLKETTETFHIKTQYLNGKIHTDFKAEHPFIMADKMHITNIFFNLMDNALKYRGQERLFEISVSTYNYKDNIIITFEDNGIGIKNEELDKIFDKFYRSHTGDRHDVKGFGLGLAYVNKIVQMHNGVIHAESVYNKWTKFIIEFPIDKLQ